MSVRENAMNRNNWTILFLTIAAFAAMVYKVRFLGYHPRMVIPVTVRKVTLDMSFKGHGNAVSIKTFVPRSDYHQTIEPVFRQENKLSFDTLTTDENCIARWENDGFKGNGTITDTFTVYSNETTFKLPRSVLLQQYTGYTEKRWLAATELIEKDAPEINALSVKLGIDTATNAIEIIKRSYHFAADSLKTAKYSSRTSAVLALKLREASCNGKSRLMVALLRHRGIPSRLVGGFIMKNGEKRTTHQWVETDVNGVWVPFCPLNRYFAKIPESYLAFYRGDEPMFTRTSNIGFKYLYTTTSKRVAPENRASRGTVYAFNILRLWELFGKAGISLELLRVLLMIPLGAIVIIIFRNVIGVHTFGTFLPVLIAVSYEDSGLLWGHLIFCTVILLGVGVRYILEKYHLLHSPKLTIILIAVICTLILLTVVGILTHNSRLYTASMFPLAICAITVERFCITIESKGLMKTLNIFFWTLVVVTFSYLSMLSTFFQTVVMTFPEVMLFFIAISIYLGSWNHLRLMEFLRFRKIIFNDKGKEDRL